MLKTGDLAMSRIKEYLSYFEKFLCLWKTDFLVWFVDFRFN